jgi:LPXTG-motif cell wall-anchored protein
MVRNAVRKFVGVALVGLLGALALPMLAAGAQTDETTTTTTPIEVGGGCAVTVPPAATVNAGTQVSISGTAPDGVTVVLFVDGVQAEKNAPTDVVLAVVTAPSGSTDGPWTLLYTPLTNVTLSVNFQSPGGNSYTAVCADNAGRTEFPVALAAQANRPAAAALAFTGSSDTPSYVLIGIAAIVVGAVLVVAARRRSQVS